MKDRMKKIICGVCTVAVCMMGTVISVDANNYVDSPYEFKFTQYTANTGYRPKLDDSSSYMKCDYATYDYNAHVVSRSSQTGAMVDCSMGRHYYFSTGTTHYMINSVFENGYREGAILGTRNHSLNYSASGVWSPDSI